MKMQGSLMGMGLLLMGVGLTPAVADTFRPERGVRCDRAAQVCYNRHGEPSFRLTRDYLGYDAARRLGWRSGPDWGYSTQ